MTYVTNPTHIFTIQRKWPDRWETVKEIHIAHRHLAMVVGHPMAWYEARRSPWRHRLLINGKEVART